MISSKSINAIIDDSGNLIANWEVPKYIDSSLSTSARFQIYFYLNGEYTGKLIQVRVPTQMGFSFVPHSVLNFVRSEGEVLKLRAQIRSNDNNNRTWTNLIPIEQAIWPIPGDIDKDGKIDLKEAIYVLQVVSGIRSSSSSSSMTLRFEGTGSDTDDTGTDSYTYELNTQIDGNKVSGTLTMTQVGDPPEIYEIINGSYKDNIIRFYVIDSDGFYYNFSLLRSNNVLDGGVIEISNGCHPWGCEYGLSAFTKANMNLVE